VGRFSEEGADQSEQIKELHRSVQEHIIWHNKQYKEHADKRGKQINDNAYKIELPGHYKVSATFNVAYMSPYIEDSDDEPDSWSSLFQEGEDDADAVNDNASLYTPLSVPVTPLKDVSLDFVLEVGRFSEEGADQSEQIKELHRSVQEQIIWHNKQYKEHADKRGKQINDNAYMIELPGHYNVSATFNVAYLSPYIEDSDDEPDSWSSLFQEGEDDADAVN
nr:hypothetical protein [Tanacetum cinerariifolium]